MLFYFVYLKALNGVAIRALQNNLQTTHIMKQLIKVQEIKELYQTPEIGFINLESEGVICASKDGNIDDWEEDDEDPIEF